MNLNQGLTDLVAVGLVAVLAPIVIALLPGPRIPQVVIFLIGGVLIGPHVPTGPARHQAIPSRATEEIRARIRWTYGNGLPGQ